MQIYGILRNRTALGLGLKENPNWKPPPDYPALPLANSGMVFRKPGLEINENWNRNKGSV